MTTLALSLPLDRISPVRVPTRDLVLGSTDSVTLLVSIVDRDSPDALPIELSGGIGGPAVTLFVWPDSRGCHGPNFGGWGCGNWDYGWGGWYSGGAAGPGTTLWTATATIYNMTTGTFRIRVPAGTLGAWPHRCRWAVFFDAEGGGEAEMLAEGRLHIRPMLSRVIDPLILLTDPNPAVLTDAEEAIFLAGAPSSSPGAASGASPPGTLPPGAISSALPIATTTVLGGVKTDGVTTRTDSSGVLTATLG
jgi:hypothetical protein